MAMARRRPLPVCTRAQRHLGPKLAAYTSFYPGAVYGERKTRFCKLRPPIKTRIRLGRLTHSKPKHLMHMLGQWSHHHGVSRDLCCFAEQTVPGVQLWNEPQLPHRDLSHVLACRALFALLFYPAQLVNTRGTSGQYGDTYHSIGEVQSSASINVLRNVIPHDLVGSNVVDSFPAIEG